MYRTRFDTIRRAVHDGFRLSLATLMVVMADVASAQEEVDHALVAPLAPQSLLLDVAVTSNRIVAVGERGHILVSTDKGASWTQATVPTRATFTGVHFFDQALGWAVGHDRVILKTSDGGVSWALQHRDPASQMPFLDIWFKDEKVGIAIGAYGTFALTDDGGNHWDVGLIEERLVVDEHDTDADDAIFYDYHLNQLVQTRSGRLFIAGEGGSLYRSADGGITWKPLQSPYRGSFFGILESPSGRLVLYGLRGHVFVSENQDNNWREISTGSTASLFGGTVLDSGDVVLVGAGGTVVILCQSTEDFFITTSEDRTALADVAEIADGRWIAVGEEGFQMLEPAADACEKHR